MANRCQIQFAAIRSAQCEARSWGASMSTKTKPIYDVEKAEELFEKFIKDFNKNYKDEEDKRIHYEAFKQSLHKINKMNTEGHATYDINMFADYTEEEMSKMRGLKKPTNA